MDWFHELAMGRGSGFSAPAPLAWGEMAHWSRLTGTPLQPWEAQALRALDAVWLRAWAASQPAPASKANGR